MTPGKMFKSKKRTAKELRSQYRESAPFRHQSLGASECSEDDEGSINSDLSIASDVDTILSRNALVELHSSKRGRPCMTSCLMLMGSLFCFVLGMGFMVAIMTNDPTFCPKLFCNNSSSDGVAWYDIKTKTNAKTNGTAIQQAPVEITSPEVACHQDQIDRDGGVKCYDLCDELLCCARNDCRGNDEGQCETYKACFQVFPEVYMAMVPPSPIPAANVEDSETASANTAPAEAIEKIEIHTVCSTDRLRADGGETCRVVCDTMTCCSDGSCDADEGIVCKDFEDCCVLNFPDSYHIN